MRKVVYTTAHALEETDEGFDLGRSTALDLPLETILDDALIARLRAGDAGYGHVRGDLELRTAVAARAGVGAEHVLITHGAIGALHLGVFGLCDQRDEVVTVTPGFPATFDIIQSLGALVRSLELDFDTGYALDVDRLAPLVSHRTRLVLLPSPHNPSGVALPAEAMRSLLALLGERAPDAFLLIDETFREATYGARTPAASAATLSPRVLTIASLSKAYGAPGLRVGWLTCRDAALLAHLAAAKGKTAISGSVLDERVALGILANAERILGDRRAGLAAGLATVEEWIARNADRLEWVRPDAGGLCCVRLRPRVYDDAAVERFYAEAAARGINLAAGDVFLGERRAFRLGFGALPAAALGTALEVLEEIAGKVVDGRR